MNHEKANKIRDLQNRIWNKKRDIGYIEDALTKCTIDDTQLFWSAYGCLSPEKGWGRNDVIRLLKKAKAQLDALEKEFESL